MATPAVLEVRGACKRFGDVTALAGIDLVIEPGAWVGLLGPNGAGKTTLVRAVAGRVRLDAGSVTVAGGQRRLGLAPQENALYPFMSARENLEQRVEKLLAEP